MTELVEHVLMLRPGEPVRFALPLDVTQADVTRLVRFLRALPLEEAPGEFQGVAVAGGILVSADTPEELARAVRLLAPPTGGEEKPADPPPLSATVAGVTISAATPDALQEAAAGVWREKAQRDTEPPARRPAPVVVGGLTAEVLASTGPKPNALGAAWTPEKRAAASARSKEVWARRFREGPRSKPVPERDAPAKSGSADNGLNTFARLPRAERRARVAEVVTRPRSMSSMSSDELEDTPIGVMPPP